MVGQCHRSNQHEFGPALGGSRRQEGLVCSGPWGHKESDTTKRLNNNNDHRTQRSEKKLICDTLSEERHIFYTSGLHGSKNKKLPPPFGVGGLMGQ